MSVVLNRLRGIAQYISEVPILQLSAGVLLGSLYPGWSVVLLGVGITGVVVTSIKVPVWRWLFIGIALISLRGMFLSDELPEDHVSQLNGQEVAVEAVVTSDTVLKSEKQSVVLEAVRACVKLEADGICNDWAEISGKIQTWFLRYPVVGQGDVVVISGDLREPEDFGDGEFSYQEYLFGKGVRSIMYRPSVEYTGERTINPLSKLVISARDTMTGKINRNLPEPHASLLAGILLGVRAGMPEDFSRDLQRTGTTHVIAASGYNVTIIANSAVMIFSFLSRKIRIILSILCIWVFVLISGASLPVVRAGLMGSMALVAVLVGSQAVVHISLPVAAAAMILFSPKIVGDVSFQLSFASTFGLVYLVPVLKKFLPWIPESLEDSTLVTLAAIISTFPITLYHFKQLSVIAPVANFLVLPVIAFVMGVGAVLLVVPGFLSWLVAIVATIAWVPLQYFVVVVEFLSGIPVALVELPEVPMWAIFALYVGLVAILVRFYPEEEQAYHLFSKI